MSTSSSAGLRRCVVCAQPVSEKKLVLVGDRRPAHRACRPVTGVPVRVAVAAATRAAATKPKAPKPMSRAQMLRRIDELRERDARKARDAEKERAAKKAAAARKAASSAGKTSASAGRAAPAKKAAAPKRASVGKDASGRGRTPSAPATGARSPAPAAPPPYYGVEMKRIGGRWVQLHPDSE
ncbi:hypothetical protein ACIQHY_21525 [Streptomyces sp. NPDC092359]|uniref:hypothetical protein n=1 Tax=Streptomyces sp. NPDC092359 TaxID=3366014 RepID=UPI0037F51E05